MSGACEAGRAGVASRPRMTEAASKKSAPHPGIAALAIAAMALAVAAVLEMLGPLRGLDAAVASRASAWAADGRLESLEMAWVWAWTVPLTCGLAFAVLRVAETWQRAVLVVTALVLSLGWLPVMILLGREAPLAVPMVALLWAAGGSLVYAARHPEVQ